MGQAREADFPEAQSRDGSRRTTTQGWPTRTLAATHRHAAQELKHSDENMILVEVYLLESRAHRGIRNFAKGKVALTSSRTAANLIYCSKPRSIFDPAHSYFFELFQNISTQGEDRVLGALKYMLLYKVMLNLVRGLMYWILDDCRQPLGVVAERRELAAGDQAREKALRGYEDELSLDPTIQSHLATLYDTLLEQNLLRIMEPYSVVEIEHVAQVME